MITLTESQSKHIRELLRSAAVRREHGEFVIEGPHLLEVALEEGNTEIRFIAFTPEAITRHEDLLARCEARKIQMLSIPAKLSSRISDTEAPQGIFAVLQIPVPHEVTGDIVIALDAVQDPGNVGTIIRTAAWFGVKSLILGEGTADPYAPKVVRSTQGAIFDVAIETKTDLIASIRMLRAFGWSVIATELGGQAQSLYDATFQSKSVLLLGSEAHGLRTPLLELADDRIMIPKYGEGESLNVATSAAIILAELRRRSP